MNAAALSFGANVQGFSLSKDDEDPVEEEILDQFSFSDLHRISQHFVGLDTDHLLNEYKTFKKDFPNNVISKEEFYELAKKSSWGKGRDQASIEQLFRAFDTNNNNSIDFKELILGTVMCTSTKATQEERLRFFFKAVDVNDNGSLSRNELANALRVLFERNKSVAEKLPPHLDTPEKITEKIFSLVDRNVDNQLSPEELVTFMKKNPEQFKALYLDLLFEINKPEKH